MAQQQQVNIADLDLSALQQVKSQLEEVNKRQNQNMEKISYINFLFYSLA